MYLIALAHGVPGLAAVRGYNASGELMANLNGLATIVSELRSERTNLVDQLRHVDAALAVLGKVNGGTPYTKPGRTLSAAGR